tara:strand:- start:116 stop:244 length:129 start_codon:yes stop_codon:yes gene_type:complete
MNERQFHIAGTIFFITATIYLLVLVWKAFVWWQWLHRLANTF